MPRLIDADALIAEVKRVYCTGCNDYRGLRCRSCATDDALDMIDDAPAIDAEPVRHGRWDENGRCTNCGGHAPYWAMATTYYKSPYCFECGAKMDLEVQHDTD